MKTYKLAVLSFFSALLMLSNSGYCDPKHSQDPMNTHTHSPERAPTIGLKVRFDHKPKIGSPSAAYVTLTSLKNGKPILLSDLKEVHTEKIHLLIFDQTLTDYQHIHPSSTSKPGEYAFTWTPHQQGNYRIWADIVPVATKSQEYVRAELVSNPKSSQAVEENVVTANTVEGLQYVLSFDQPDLKENQPVMGRFTIQDQEGRPFKQLEPIMGAFAHIVAINEDFETIAHVHPLGEEALSPQQRSGPTLDFHLSPPKAGFLKIWLQVKINGKEAFIPFGVQVKK